MRPRTVAFSALIAFAALALGLDPARAQGLHSVFSRDGIDVWAVGDAGTIARSFDGGTTWTSQTLGSGTLRDVAAVSLVVVIVGENGTISRSVDGGGAWASATLPGTPALHAVAAASSAEWYVAGAQGTIAKSVDGGENWDAQSFASATLRALRFTDPEHGWAVGDGGTVLRTVDGGANWTPVAVSTTQRLYDVDANGSTVWVVGAGGVARRSRDGGDTWEPVNLRLDARSDVRSVWLKTADVVFLAGGGGFIRRSLDGGQTWFFPKHVMQAPISSLYFAGGRAWAANEWNPVVMTSTDQDQIWSLPSGTSVSRMWVSKLPTGASIRGSTLRLFPFDSNTLDVALGNEIWRSRNLGDSWTKIATVPSSGIFNAYEISPKDSNIMVVAVNVPPKHLSRSADGGLNWTTVFTHDFGDFGIPLETHPDRPDTMYFGGDTSPLFRSIDRGEHWNPLPGPYNFRSPCDIVVVPDSGDVILVGDGITGTGRAEFHKSTNAGQSFAMISQRPAGTSEIPGMACSRLRNNVTFGTNWGSGGVQRSADYGGSWPSVSAVGSAWGIDVSKDDPNCMIFGVYSGGSTYLSLDGGDTFISTGLANSNYSFLIRDRATIFAEQSNGIFRLQTQYLYAPSSTQALTVSSPNGGETWAAGSTHAITWTATNVGAARIEYRRSPSDPWQEIAMVPSDPGSYAWQVPDDGTTTASIRVRDAWDGSPVDASNATFTITVFPQLLVDQDPLDLATTPVGYSRTAGLDLENHGTAPVQVTSVAVDNARFRVGRTSFTIPPHGADTIGVTHEPVSEGPDSALVTIVSNDPASPRVVRIRGTGTSALAAPGGATGFALWQNHPNPFTGTTRIAWSLPSAAPVRLEVFDLLGHRVAVLVNEPQQPGLHAASFGPGVRTKDGAVGALPSGVYFYRLAAGRMTSTRRMLIMR